MAVRTVAANTGVSVREVEAMVSWGAERLTAEATALKARPASSQRDALLCAARGAWLIATAPVRS